MTRARGGMTAQSRHVQPSELLGSQFLCLPAGTDDSPSITGICEDKDGSSVLPVGTGKPLHPQT